jgi:hypothetical protein
MAHPDFEELLASFNAKRVRYLVGGAHALAHHARPRASKDLDIYIEATAANARRAVAALEEFFGGRAPKYVDITSLLAPGMILQLGVAPVRVDLLNSLATTSFRQAWKRRSVSVFGKVPCSFIGVDDLIAEKQFFARPQDLVDVVVLQRAKHIRRASTKTRRRRSASPKPSRTTKGRPAGRESAPGSRRAAGTSSSTARDRIRSVTTFCKRSHERA